MKTREEIIYSMCLTFRHDYGLLKHPEDLIGSGMTKEEQESLWNKMEQIYDNCISEHINPSLTEVSVESEGNISEWTDEKREELKKILKEIFPEKYPKQLTQFPFVAPINPPHEWGKCPVCHGEYKHMTHYVCNHYNCPTKVTCL